MRYFYLALTIIFESSAIILMKLSGGFEKKVWAVSAVSAYVLSFIFLTLALKRLDAGLANAIWAGCSTLFVAVAGVIVFKEQLSFLHCVFLVLIIIGVAGLSLVKNA